MRTVILIFTGILLVYSELIAQEPSLAEVEVRWAEKEGLEGGIKVLGADNQYIYLAGLIPRRGPFNPAKWLFYKYSRENMELTWKAEIKAPKSAGDYIEAYTVGMRGGRFELKYKAYDKSEDKHYLVTRYMSEDGELEEPRNLTSLDSDDDDEGNISYKSIPHSGELLIWKTPQFEDREDTRKIEIQVLNAQWGYHETFSTKVEFPYSYKHSYVLEVNLSEDGDIYVLLMKTPERHKGEEEMDDQSNQKFLLYRIDGQSGDHRAVNLELDHLFISKMKMLVDFKTGTTAITGIYSEQDDDYIKGTYLVLVDGKSMQVEKSVARPLEPHVLAEYKSEYVTELGDEVRNYFEFSDFFRRPEGGGIVVYEDREIVIVPNARSFRYGDIVLQKISPEGDLEWSVVIPRLNLASMYYQKDYMAVETGNELKFVFNDHEDNHRRWGNPEERTKELRFMRRGLVAMVTVDMSGEMEYRILTDSRINSRDFIPDRSLYEPDRSRELIMIYQSHLRFQMAELLLRE